MQAQFESFFKDLGAAAAAAGGEGDASVPAPGPARSAAGASASAPTGGEASFQETIRQTMERMQASGEQATAAAAADGSDDFMAELLKQMQAGGLDGGEGSEEELSKMLMGMMEQLTNKDILYEPMKELDEKFPEWMEKNGGTVSEEDRKRYELQQVYVKEIVTKFEESTYSDSNAADREYIVERMQKVSFNPRPQKKSLVTNLVVMNRCRMRDHRPLIWLETCHPLRTPLVHLIWILVTLNKNRFSVIQQKAKLELVDIPPSNGNKSHYITYIP